MDFPVARHYFYAEINQPDEQINLAKAALYIAQEEYPELDIYEYLNVLDTMAAEVQKGLPSERYPLRIIQSINKYLYTDLKFVGNTNDYYDPRNSFFNNVIERKTGIPITLALVYLEVSKRLDFPMVGIGMPGHFLIRPEFEEVGIFVDAFNQGEILFEQDCKERLTQMYGYPITLQPEFLAPVNSRRFLARMLTNLKMIYLKNNNWQKALASIEKILLLFPDDPMELRDRGILYYQMGDWQNAAEDLEIYLAILPNAEDAIAIRQLLERISNL